MTYKKDRGGLFFPSPDIVKVAEIAESKILEAKIKDQLFSDGQILNQISVKAVSTCHAQYPEVCEAADHGKIHKYSLLKETVL